MSGIDSGMDWPDVSGKKKNGITAEMVNAPMTRFGNPASIKDKRSTRKGAMAAPSFEQASNMPYVPFRTEVGKTSLVRSPTPRKLMLHTVLPKMMRIGRAHREVFGKAMISMPRMPPIVKVTIMHVIRPN